MGALSKLEAVNRMLTAAGEFPVSTLSVTGSNDVTIAVQMLDETSTMIQMAGTNTNTLFTTLTPDTAGKIYVADNIISLDTTGYSRDRNVALEGRNPTYLVDLDNERTSTFAQGTELEVKMVLNLPFEDLETADQYAACDLAARRYQYLTVGDQKTDAILQEQAILSRIQSRAKDIRSRDANFTRNTKSSWGAIGARRLIGPW